MKFSAAKPLQFSLRCLKLRPWLFILGLIIGWPANLLITVILLDKDSLLQIFRPSQAAIIAGTSVVLLIINSTAQVVITKKLSSVRSQKKNAVVLQKKLLSQISRTISINILATIASIIIMVLCYLLPLKTNGQSETVGVMATVLLIILTLWKVFAVFFAIEYSISVARAVKLSLDILKRKCAEILLLSVELGALYIFGFLLASGLVAGTSVLGGINGTLASLAVIMLLWMWISVQNLVIFISLYAAFQDWTNAIENPETKLATESLL